MNNNLTKEVRADYTGKLVTRTVKVDSGSGGAAKKLPSPKVSPTKVIHEANPIPKSDQDRAAHSVDLTERSRPVNTAVYDALTDDMTIDRQLELFEENRSIISECHRWASYGDQYRFPTPGEAFSRRINERLLDEHERPEQVGGMRVRLVAGGKDRTIEIHADDPAPGQDADMDDLIDKAARKLRVKSDNNLNTLLKSASFNAVRGGAAGCNGGYCNDESQDYGVDLHYAEIILLPSRREEFIKQGGTAAIADGAL
jgi:hypothetical protein